MKKLFMTVVGFILGLSTACSQSNMEYSAEDSKDAIVELQTSMGDVVVELFNDTPLHRDNFLKLVKEGYYDGVLFHRVINDFMVQTGDPESKGAAPGAQLGSGDPGYTIEAEIVYPKHYHKYGALAAARTGDAMNPQKRSSGSQFYIVTGDTYTEGQLEKMDAKRINSEMQNYFQNLAMSYRDSIQSMQRAGNHDGLEALRQELIKQTEAAVHPEEMSAEMKSAYSTQGGTPHLDGSYTVFGQVLKGMDVIDKLQKVETDNSDRPLEDVKIISAKVLKDFTE
ncbi:MAG: peptidylprolyl isomerase [Bacteroides sp.]|nr:peptidylprolyl isomerase [Bacteroides sp.]